MVSREQSVATAECSPVRGAQGLSIPMSFPGDGGPEAYRLVLSYHFAAFVNQHQWPRLSYFENRAGPSYPDRPRRWLGRAIHQRNHP